MAAVCTAVTAPGRLTLDGLVSSMTVVTLTVGTVLATAVAAAVSRWRCATRGTIPISRGAANTPPAIAPPSPPLTPRRPGEAGGAFPPLVVRERDEQDAVRGGDAQGHDAPHQ